MNKKEIRKIMLDKRKSIDNKKELSTIIVNKIIALNIYKKAEVVALYKSMDMEVNTDSLIHQALIDKKVLLPKIINDKMSFIEIDENTKYLKSEIGVMEPIGSIYEGVIDLIIVPGVCFDKKLNRIGFGRGYYDKFLNNHDIYKIGICFDDQVINQLPVNEYDVKMDLIITDYSILKKV